MEWLWSHAWIDFELVQGWTFFVFTLSLSELPTLKKLVGAAILSHFSPLAVVRISKQRFILLNETAVRIETCSIGIPSTESKVEE
jgi:hypothetical protein